MIHSCIDLSEKYPALHKSTHTPLLYTYIQETSEAIDKNKVWPAIVICPGGGYGFTSDREAEPVAIQFLQAGFQVFILRYSTEPNRYPTQLLELSASLAFIRENAKEWHIDPDKIAVCGFSAGGHLTASLANFWTEDWITQELAIKKEHNKPNAVVLAYPVISMGEYAHTGSFENLLGSKLTLPEYKKLSLETSINKHNPPTFIWHTLTDALVPVQNALLYANALITNTISVELHIYPEGVHGLSLANHTTAAAGNQNHINPHVETWFASAVKWLHMSL